MKWWDRDQCTCTKCLIRIWESTDLSSFAEMPAEEAVILPSVWTNNTSSSARPQLVHPLHPSHLIFTFSNFQRQSFDCCGKVLTDQFCFPPAMFCAGWKMAAAKTEARHFDVTHTCAAEIILLPPGKQDPMSVHMGAIWNNDEQKPPLFFFPYGSAQYLPLWHV